jgi:hypothetical protein
VDGIDCEKDITFDLLQGQTDSNIYCHCPGKDVKFIYTSGGVTHTIQIPGSYFIKCQSGDMSVTIVEINGEHIVSQQDVLSNGALHITELKFTWHPMSKDDCSCDILNPIEVPIQFRTVTYDLAAEDSNGEYINKLRKSDSVEPYFEDLTPAEQEAVVNTIKSYYTEDNNITNITVLEACCSESLEKSIGTFTLKFLNTEIVNSDTQSSIDLMEKCNIINLKYTESFLPFGQGSGIPPQYPVWAGSPMFNINPQITGLSGVATPLPNDKVYGQTAVVNVDDGENPQFTKVSFNSGTSTTAEIPGDSTWYSVAVFPGNAVINGIDSIYDQTIVKITDVNARYSNACDGSSGIVDLQTTEPAP